MEKGKAVATKMEQAMVSKIKLCANYYYSPTYFGDGGGTIGLIESPDGKGAGTYKGISDETERNAT